jgi:hypothetical protein
MSRLSIGLVIRHQDDGHTHFDVAAKLLSDDDDRAWHEVWRGMCGNLTMRTDEFDAFVERLSALHDNFTHVDVYRQGEYEHPCRIKAGVS